MTGPTSTSKTANFRESLKNKNRMEDKSNGTATDDLPSDEDVEREVGEEENEFDTCRTKRRRRTKEEIAADAEAKQERARRRVEKREYRKEIKLGHYKKKVFDITPTERVDDTTWKVLESLCPSGRVLLQYSTGKDSTAAWFELKQRGFTVVPYFKESFRGLSFFDKVIAAHEEFFQQEILIIPNIIAVSELMSFFNGEQDLARLGSDVQGAVQNGTFSKAGIRAYRQKTIDHLMEETNTEICVMGTKASDSLHRRTHYRVDGPYNPKDRIFGLVWRLTKNAPLRIMIDNKIPIPLYYLWLGRSPNLFLENEFFMIKKYYPEDYEKLHALLPNIDVFVAKYEANKNTKHILKPAKFVVEAYQNGHPFV